MYLPVVSTTLKGNNLIEELLNKFSDFYFHFQFESLSWSVNLHFFSHDEGSDEAAARISP